jgi:preprotein translocase subunit YajC
MFKRKICSMPFFALLTIGSLLAASVEFPTLALAQTATSPENPVTTSGMLLRMAVMFVMVFFIFNVLVIKPQKRKLADQAKLASELRKGDQVITTGGILGRVVTIEKESLTLEIASGVRVKFEPASIVRRVELPQAKDKDAA